MKHIFHASNSDTVLLWGLFILSFIAINVLFFLIMDVFPHFAGFIYVLLFEFYALGSAFDLSRLISCLILDEVRLPRTKIEHDFPPIALLCVTCDDADAAVLKRLDRQDYPNLDVFVLDDSRHLQSQQLVDSVGLKVVRRGRTAGYKAGNLNNWLFNFGDSYRYFVIADADSLLPNGFVRRMVSYAEHPANSGVAVFESIVIGWNSQNRFAHLLGSMWPLAKHLRLRVDNRFDAVFSVGHNNLYRTAVIKDIGGFTEDYLAEDYATSIKVLQAGKHCLAVPVLSFERLPENTREFVRRQARWAVQTLQLSSMRIAGLPWYSRLLLLMAMHYYTLPVMTLIGMLYLICVTFINKITAIAMGVSAFAAGMSVWIPRDVLLLWLGLFLVPHGLRYSLARSAGIRLRVYLVCVFFHAALSAVSLWPVVRRVLGFWDRQRLHFNVTGKAPSPSLLEIASLNWPVYLCSLGVFLAIAMNPRGTWVNLIWAIPVALAPFMVHLGQRTD